MTPLQSPLQSPTIEPSEATIRPLPLIPSTSSALLSEEDRDTLERLPASITEVIRRLYVTGMASSLNQIGTSLKSLFGLNLSDSVISHIVNSNLDKWLEQRASYLKELENRYQELQVKLETSPIDSRHYQLLTKLEMVAHAQADKLVHCADDETSLKFLGQLTDISSKLVNTFQVIPSIKEKTFEVPPKSGTDKEPVPGETIIMERIIRCTTPEKKQAARDSLAKFEEKTDQFIKGMSEDREL